MHQGSVIRACRAGTLRHDRAGWQYLVPESAVTECRRAPEPDSVRRGWEAAAAALRKLARDAGPGGRLPSLRAMADERGIPVTWVRTAYVHLEAEGLVRVVPGHGFYVREPAGDGAS
jgi:hypothetical protein